MARGRLAQTPTHECPDRVGNIESAAPIALAALASLADLMHTNDSSPVTDTPNYLIVFAYFYPSPFGLHMRQCSSKFDRGVLPPEFLPLEREEVSSVQAPVWGERQIETGGFGEIMWRECNDLLTKEQTTTTQQARAE